MTLVENIVREIKQSKKEYFEREEVLQIIKHYTSSHYKPNIESGGILLNPEQHLVYINGNKKSIPKRMFDLLYYLIENKHRVSSRENIIRDVWGTDICVNDRTIDVHIRKIKIALEDNNCIKSFKRVGYVWVR